MADRVGQRLGNYRLIRLLGRGGFAEVYLGEHRHLGTQAAIKVLFAHLGSQTDVENFRREAQTIARLIHPHIVRVLDFDVEQGEPFLVMEYAPHGSLRTHHPRGVPLPLPLILSHVQQVANALQYAHENKLIHRDVKPDNMLLREDGSVVLSDFGIVTIAHSTSSRGIEAMAGTAAYMAPEQMQGEPRPASDQYALAVAIYEWITGRPPFQGTAMEVAMQHAMKPPPSLVEQVPTLPQSVEQVVMTALAKDPKERFGNVRAFATALEQASRSYPDMRVLPGQSPSSTEVPVLLNKVITPPGQPPVETAIPPGQPSLPSAQVTPSAQLLQSAGRDTPPNQLSQTMEAVPPRESPSRDAVIQDRPPLSSFAPERSGDKIQPRTQRISRPMLLLSLAVLVAVVVAGGGIAWLELAHGPGFINGFISGVTGNSSSSTTNSGSTSGGIIGSTTIKIATDLPASGADASSGKPVENAVHLAIDQANANHTIPGYTLVFDPKDDVGPSGIHDPAVGAQNVTSLISDALVAGIVGPFNSSVAKAEMPITNQGPLAQISPSNTNPCLTQEGPAVGCSGTNDLVPTLRPTSKVTYFRIATTDDHQGTAGADYLLKTLHYKKVYIIDDAESYGIELANTFSAEWKNLGGTVLGHSSEPSSTTSYVSLLTQVASLHPDVIYFGGLDSTGGTLIRQQMQQIAGLQNTPFGGGDGIVTPNFASTIGLRGGPVYGSIAVVDDSQNPSVQTFLSQYKAAYGDSINISSAAGYDCANILIQAIKKALANGTHTPKNSSDAAGARLFRQAVINAIQGISFNGVTGHHSFDGNGDTTNKVISIYKLAANTSGSPDWIYQTAVTVS